MDVILLFYRGRAPRRFYGSECLFFFCSRGAASYIVALSPWQVPFFVGLSSLLLAIFFSFPVPPVRVLLVLHW